MSLRKDDPRLRFGQPNDATVIHEKLIDRCLTPGESGKPYFEIKFLSLSYQSNIHSIFHSDTSDYSL